MYMGPLDLRILNSLVMSRGQTLWVIFGKPLKSCLQFLVLLLQNSKKWQKWLQSYFLFICLLTLWLGSGNAQAETKGAFTDAKPYSFISPQWRPGAVANILHSHCWAHCSWAAAVACTLLCWQAQSSSQCPPETISSSEGSDSLL